MHYVQQLAHSALRVCSGLLQMETGGGVNTAVQESLSDPEVVISLRMYNVIVEGCSTSRGTNTGTTEYASHHWLC